ncbi:helix-turn-helix transcriptional regulator [Bacillus aquiflavi]|uniref:Helix-turn-helix transcriptional regulator n=1 Tax=Bacillus aquiflavi TaxID=2672567 RepID=A0A6B3VW24_9BACI|nr:helix-turn-helix transcriptional regulator [Bacillus aquiflavi]MBA4538120.1 helix-turn-helix transcriptional regulator [Bacillus aquiflavi]NEY82440.1 helix-turn-helix transcriptional regulator [Bacillus aquiflavi]
MDILAKRLKALRAEAKAKDKRFTQEYVGKLIGVARTTYTAYENGTKEPSLETVNKLADIFNVTTDYLQGRTDIRNFQQINEEKAKFIINDPELRRWYNELPEIGEEELKKLHKVWKIFKNEE